MFIDPFQVDSNTAIDGDRQNGQVMGMGEIEMERRPCFRQERFAVLTFDDPQMRRFNIQISCQSFAEKAAPCHKAVPFPAAEQPIGPGQFVRGEKPC